MARVVQSVAEDCPKMTSTMNDADNFHGTFGTFVDTIKRDVTFNREAPKPDAKFIVGAACKGSG